MASKEITNRFIAVALADTFEIDPGDEKKAPGVRGYLRVCEGDDIGRDLPWRGSLADLKPGAKMAAQDITFKQLRAMGWSDNDIVKRTGLGSTKVEVTETMDEYNGKVRPQYSVWEYRGERPTLREDDKKDFAKRFKALAAAAPALSITPANQAPAIPAARETNHAEQASSDGFAAPTGSPL